MIDGERPVANDLLRALQGVEAQSLQLLSNEDWEYLLRYMKERTQRGSWLQVYPNVDNAQLHSTFLEQQKRNPARLALHDVLMLLEKQAA